MISEKGYNFFLLQQCPYLFIVLGEVMGRPTLRFWTVCPLKTEGRLKAPGSRVAILLVLFEGMPPLPLIL